MFKNILKAVASGILDAIPIVPNFLDKAKMKQDKEAIKKLLNDRATAMNAKYFADEIRYGSNESAGLISKVQDLLDTIDDGVINDSIPDDRAEKIIRGLTTVISGGLILWGFIQQILEVL